MVTASTMIPGMMRNGRPGSKRAGGPLARGGGPRPGSHQTAENVGTGPLVGRSQTKRVVAADEPPAPCAAEPAALYRLMAWLSPSYPVGAFSYSNGLEWAVEAGDVTDAASLQSWLEVLLVAGGAFCDAALFVHVHGAVACGDDRRLRDAAELAAALSPSKERHLETTAQGRAFLDVSRSVWPCPAIGRLLAAWDGAVAYPVAVAVTAAGHGIPVALALNAYLYAASANLVSAGVRLIPLGQTDGQRVQAALEPVILAAAQRALATPLDGIGTAAFRADLASMRHETQYTRLFRS
jgi:urease accessory protein